ncbi:hypothetical protein ACPA54_23860 [Uniformispora flossi]|uniref:hypothetical protein n=1 Tax=Uniformispora flossi TaxID=3390723 RepID=UPI003C2E66D5
MSKLRRAAAAAACTAALTTGTFAMAGPAAAAPGYLTYDCTMGAATFTGVDVSLQRTAAGHVTLVVDITPPPSIAADIFANVGHAVLYNHYVVVPPGPFFLEGDTFIPIGTPPPTLDLRFISAGTTMNCTLVHVWSWDPSI